MEKSRILIIGATGNLGHRIAKESLKYGHQTTALVRETSFFEPKKSAIIETLECAGCKIIKGSLQEHERLVEAIRGVDVVICAVSSKQVLEQKLLIRAIKEAGSIKRFIPAEFGADPDKVQVFKLAQDFYANKAEIRRSIEKEEIPYTLISCNYFTSVLLPSLGQPGLKVPPRDQIQIFGDGKIKAIFVNENDVAAFTIATVDDPRTLNKVLYLRPPGNICSMIDLVNIWEDKTGRRLERIYVPEGEFLEKIQVTPYPTNMEMVFVYSAFVKGDHTYFDIGPSGLNATELYPNLKCTTVSEYLDTLL